MLEHIGLVHPYPPVSTLSANLYDHYWHVHTLGAANAQHLSLLTPWCTEYASTCCANLSTRQLY
jgi:hypothetical protein